MAHHLAHENNNYGEFRDVRYTYDELNRLTKVNDSKQDVFDEIFAYDAQGRITAQRRAGNVVNPTGGEYSYYSGKNRLKSVADNMGGTADERNMSDTANFVYDSVGNLTYDKSKEMEILYDWRGMPIEFIQQSQPAGSSSDTLFRLLMKYDGTGRRISKTVMHKVAGAADWDTAQVTHYTGIGTEIRENYAGPTKQTKVVVNMPQSLGRYGIEDAENPDMGSGVGYIPNTKFEWYLKNHLGSTMLVYGTPADANPAHSDIGTPLAAYDYRAFGEMVELLPPPTGKVTENFTGKEHDDEIALNYFGARYLDPMLGMWISVDPARQFASPYLYAGNGVNPVNVVDPDGNDVQIKNEQSKILGMINQASYNQYELDGNTLIEGSTCNEKGNIYFSGRLDAAIYSDNVITAEMDPTNTDAINGGEGVTYMTGDYGMPGANARIVITGRSYGKSSAAQNTVHELVSHAIPFILGDRNKNGSALDEERKAIEGVFPVPDVPDHPIYDDLP